MAKNAQRVLMSLPVKPVSAERAMAIAKNFSLLNLPPDFIAAPYPYYRALRDHAPVKRCADGTVLLTRHADLERVYRDTTTFSSGKTEEFLPKYGDTPTYEHHTTSLVFNDPPLHTRVRSILQGAMTPRAFANLRPELVALVDRLIDQMEVAGEVDFIEQFAAAIPVEIVGNLLAIPFEDRAPLRGWSLAILGALEPNLSAADREKSDTAITEFLAYLSNLIVERKRMLGDPETDVLSRLIIGSEVHGKLSAKELMHNCIFLLNAGHETTTNLIGNGLVLLHQWPGERDRLVADPSLISTTVEEVLRFESSNQLGNRRTVMDAEIGGHPIPAKTSLTLVIGAANRDPTVFDSPDTFDISRKPNRHLAFGGGPHVCLGLGLARLEGAVALSRLVERYPDYRLLGEPARSQRVRFRGFSRILASLV